MSENKDFLMYKGRPLVRCDNVIYYGNTSDKYILKLEILSSNKVGTLKCADKVSVKVVSSDNKDHIIKEGERVGLYKALDLGYTWLNKELSSN